MLSIKGKNVEAPQRSALCLWLSSDPGRVVHRESERATASLRLEVNVATM